MLLDFGARPHERDTSKGFESEMKFRGCAMGPRLLLIEMVKKFRKKEEEVEARLLRCISFPIHDMGGASNPTPCSIEHLNIGPIRE